MMSSLPVKLKPLNRHLLIVPNFLQKEKEDTPGILLPEDYKPLQQKYVAATVVDLSMDCSSLFQSMKRERGEILVDRNMIEEVVYRDKTYYIILENYVVGFLNNF